MAKITIQELVKQDPGRREERMKKFHASLNRSYHKSSRLTNFLVGGVLTGAGILELVGCNTLPIGIGDGKGKFPKEHIHGVEYQIMDQSRVPYKLEEQVLYGVRYYLQERDETPETLPLAFLPFDKVTREIDLDSGKTILNSKEKYVPKLVEVKEYTKDKWADEIELRVTDSEKTGVKGIKANMTSLEELRKIAKVSEDNYGYKVITTEDGASFIIKTIKILGNEYFLPHVSDKKTDEKEKLPFHLIPVKRAKIKIQNPCGNVTIRNENKIFRPELVKDEIVKEELTPGQSK